MLILTRSTNETVVISDMDTGKVLCTVVLAEGHCKKAKLGFIAPSDVSIMRGEIVCVDSPRPDDVS